MGERRVKWVKLIPVWLAIELLHAKVLNWKLVRNITGLDFDLGFVKLEIFKRKILNHKEQKASLHIDPHFGCFLEKLESCSSREETFGCGYSMYHVTQPHSCVIIHQTIKSPLVAPLLLVHLQVGGTSTRSESIHARPKRKFKFKIWFRNKINISSRHSLMRASTPTLPQQFKWHSALFMSSLMFPSARLRFVIARLERSRFLEQIFHAAFTRKSIWS